MIQPDGICVEEFNKIVKRQKKIKRKSLIEQLDLFDKVYTVCHEKDKDGLFDLADEKNMKFQIFLKKIIKYIKENVNEQIN